MKITIEVKDGRLSLDLGSVSTEDASGLLRAASAAVEAGRPKVVAVTESFFDRFKAGLLQQIRDVTDPTCTVCSQLGHLSFQCPNYTGNLSRIHNDELTAARAQCKHCGAAKGVRCQ